MLSMVDSATNNTKMKILYIVRSEGLGETSLAEEVFDMASPQFDCGAFVRVGQNADLKKVLTDILIGLDKKKYKDLPTNVLDLLELIRLFSKSLINKRYATSSSCTLWKCNILLNNIVRFTYIYICSICIHIAI
jgi:hypothetical protein